MMVYVVTPDAVEVTWLQHSTVDQKSQAVQASSLFHPGKPSPGAQMHGLEVKVCT